MSSEGTRSEEDGAGVEANPSHPASQPTRTDTGPSDGSREVRDGLWSDLDYQDCDDRPDQTTEGDTAEADPLSWGSDPTDGEAVASGRTDGRPDAVVSRRHGGREHLGATPTPLKWDRAGHHEDYEYPNEWGTSSPQVAEEYRDEVPAVIEWSDYFAYQCRHCHDDCINRLDSGPAEQQLCRSCAILDLDGCLTAPVFESKPERTVPSDD